MADFDKTAFSVELCSFGFLYGEENGELTIDSRFLPNPYYVDSLKPLSGLDRACADYVLSFPAARKTLESLKELVLTQARGFLEQGRTGIKVCIGCTGGRHRSVALVEALVKEIAAEGFSVKTSHRDIQRYPS